MREGDFRGVMAPKPVPSRNTFSRAVQPEPRRDARRRLDLESGKGTLCPRLRAKARFPKVSISKHIYNHSYIQRMYAIHAFGSTTYFKKKKKKGRPL